jgi:hypothetical protein
VASKKVASKKVASKVTKKVASKSRKVSKLTMLTGELDKVNFNFLNLNLSCKNLYFACFRLVQLIYQMNLLQFKF